MTAKQLRYWDYDPDATIACSECGWAGSGAGNEEMFEALLDVKCPQCCNMLLMVQYPTVGETREAAAAGNQRAVAELPRAEAGESRHAWATGLLLREPTQLPDLNESDVTIDWDFENRDGEDWTVLRHLGVEIWREPAFYEGYPRFVEVFEILRQRYRTRLREVRPTAASGQYLYGGRLGSLQIVKDLNAGLRKGEQD